MTRVGLESLDDLFGFRHSIVLLADGASQRLFTVAAHGYPDGRVGSEVTVGEGSSASPPSVGNQSG